MAGIEDPYAAPEIAPADQFEPGSTVPTRTESLNEIARSTFLAWEKRRFIYIGVLAVVSVAMGAVLPSTPVLTPLFWMTVVVGAIPANLCYFAGPIVETYVRWLGFRVSLLRPALFFAGTLFAAVLAAVVVAELELF